MSDFFAAFESTMGAEGAFACNPNDHGGMTYKGIARQFWPKWGGWKYIDGAIDQLTKMPTYGTKEYLNWARHLNKCLADINALQSLVKTFYKTNFWDTARLEEVQDQRVADWIFDHHVNGGARGVKWIQEAAGAAVDGQIGPASIAAINDADPLTLLERARNIAGNYRLEKIKKDPTQRQFIHSWLARDGFSATEIKDMIASV